LKPGVYFLAGIVQDIHSIHGPVGYVGQGTGIGGLEGRCQDHHDLKSRLRDLRRSNGKFLYKYTEGLADGEKRIIRICAIAIFNALPADSPPMDIFYDLVEAVFVILLGTMSETRNVHEFVQYKALRPLNFTCQNSFIPTNKIVPAQTHLNQPTIAKDSTEFQELQLATTARYDCGFRHQEVVHIDFVGLGKVEFRRALAKVLKKYALVAVKMN